MKTGDVIAFSHDNFIGEIIQKATDSYITHVALVLDTFFLCNKNFIKDTLIIEAVPEGVVFNFLEKRLFEDWNTVWYLPLAENLYNKINIEKLLSFIKEVVHHKYDYIQAARSALDRLSIDYNEENFEKFFCSELVSASLEISGAISEVNASEATPIDVCRWKIYDGPYTKLLGNRDIEGYNTLPVYSE